MEDDGDINLFGIEVFDPEDEGEAEDEDEDEDEND